MINDYNDTWQLLLATETYKFDHPAAAAIFDLKSKIPMSTHDREYLRYFSVSL